MLNICKNFVNLGEDFFSYVKPQGIENPKLILNNNELASKLNLADQMHEPEWLSILSANTTLEQYQPLSSIYSGHQFGTWVSKLGDGRAMLIAEHKVDNDIWELQLKGSGITPYSRMGDGRAVLRSSIREYLCSHAMAKLNVPTTKALAIVNSDTQVIREEIETAAIVLRVARSFIRFGHFELFASQNQIPQLKLLTDFVIKNYYPDCSNGSDPAAILLDKVASNTAYVIAKWQAIGFCHGVMNSDNMSILGLTLDYGPFGFMETYDPKHICNTSDHDGRYSYENQPDIALWNLNCLANALLPISKKENLLTSLNNFVEYFNQAYLKELGNKLGIVNFTVSDLELLKDLLLILEEYKFDWTIFWRKLSHLKEDDYTSLNRFIDKCENLPEWLSRYYVRRQKQSLDFIESQKLMLNSNPAIILRNYLAHNAIEKAKLGDLTEFNNLFKALSNPYKELPEFNDYYDNSPNWAASICVSCSS